MLVLTRRVNERIKIGPDIEIIITDIKPDVIKIGINAPKTVAIYRAEVYAAIEDANRLAALPIDATPELNNILSELNTKLDK
ncbi:MAG: carbon storage regulator CsrA [Peptococcaceae bacterium]|nr:carbon storage regulator CsrA [Peptococcaceae bacterium]